MLTPATAREAIERMARCRILVVGDVMLDHFIWGHVRRISPEAPVENRQLLDVGRILLEKWNVPHVLITLGEQGMILFQRGDEPHHIPTRAQEVFDD